MQHKNQFNKKRVRQAFDRASSSYDAHAVLQQEVTNRLLEKLTVVKLSPEMILDAGCGTGNALSGLQNHYPNSHIVALDLAPRMLQTTMSQNRSKRLDAVCADIECLPFDDDSFDLIFSSLSLQWCNHLDQAFKEAWRVLKPGGLYVFSNFGPDTLKELRQSWRQVDSAEHVNQFVDMHDVGDLLLHTGFAEPVMESEIITLTYNTIEAVMHDLKGIGANVKNEAEFNSDTVTSQHSISGLGGKTRLKQLRQAYEAYRTGGQLPVSYEISYGHAWKFVDNRARKVEFTPMQRS